ncbi:Arrestin domain-containing protein 2 [Choanephora cucurbitarum]|uniref:Arrestin domain-containing protein 2 n=1 Tax=Choanephora cucurbitarum TaxID=101091 RepID=A0A1C7NKP8_9FUNG|nr:Arrestin domain-containing protein 2 [Choanephora cucurbitarum]
MRNRLKSNKVIDIVLSEEKFYFPGDTIQGVVFVKPKSSIKVNSIHVKFIGTIYLQAKEKESMSLFHVRETIPMKVKVLESKEHRFPFQFSVPEKLPSAMDLNMKRMFKVDYRLEAILDRPMVPESLCPQVVYPVVILECIDITREVHAKPLEEQKLFVLPDNHKCHIKLSLPRTGYTRGETIPVNVIVNTSQSFVHKEGIAIDLVRKMETHTVKNQQKKEDILKSERLGLNIIGPYNFSQSVTTQLLIRTTPPTLQYRDILSVQYVIRIQIYDVSSKTKPVCRIELPIIIGTWPRAAVPIDEDDEDIIQYMGELMVGDEIDEDAREDDEDDDDEHWMMDPPPQGEQDFEIKKGPYLHQPIRRSGSNGSLQSNSSWIAKLDQRFSTPIPEGYLMAQNSTPYNRHSIIPPAIPSPPQPQHAIRLPTEYLNRSSSAPNLFHPPPPPPPSSNARESIHYHDPSPTPVSSMPLPHSSPRPHYIQQHRASAIPFHHRGGSDGFVAPNEVPNHTLTFIQTQPQPTQSSFITEEDSDVSSASDSEDEDDLFAIIQKKRRTEERRKRQQRQTFTTVA